MKEYQLDDFIKATVTNDLKTVTECLEQGMSPNAKNKQMLSPFIASAANGHVELFRLFLKYQPDVLQVNKFGGTALIPASEKGFIEVVEIGVTTGIPINHVNRLGWSALLEAVILGDGGFLYQDIIRELLLSGADNQQKDFYQKDSYDYASELQQISISSLLANSLKEDNFSEIRSFLKVGDIISAITHLITMPESAKKNFYLGQSYERLKRYKEADYYYQKEATKDAQFYFYLANNSRRQDNMVAAFEYLDKGIESSDAYFYRYHKTNFLRDTGKHEEALIEMARLLKEYPERVDFLFHQANSLESLGKIEAAIETLHLADRYQKNNKLFIEQASRLEMSIKEKK